ncbi:MAG: peroxide stress protein YaaA, partial [Bacteroidota bacterium]|nr:peroxide stress protein YaaA [Bacteroidota bacterium]
DLQFAQHHLRILSGLYGILRPLDLIQPYRLMMGVKVSPARGRKDLYAWWKDRITVELKKVLKKSGSKVIINLASDEYFKAVDTEALGAEVITPIFKDKHAGTYKLLSVFFKHQRGAMTRHIIQNRILEPEKLKRYTGDEYYFSAEDSTANEWIFLRDKRPG